MEEAERIGRKTQALCEKINALAEKTEKEFTSKVQELGSSKKRLSTLTQKIATELQKNAENARKEDQLRVELLCSQSIEISELIEASFVSLGAATAAAALALGGVTLFGTASSGIAISALSGAALSSATLAFLGAGGLGIAGGAAVLGGLIAGPALLIGGAIFAYKASEALDEANAQYDKVQEKAKEVKANCEIAYKISSTAYADAKIINSSVDKFENIFNIYCQGRIPKGLESMFSNYILIANLLLLQNLVDENKSITPAHQKAITLLEEFVLASDNLVSLIREEKYLPNVSCQSSSKMI